ncbi:MAG: hypothetical protein JNM95_02565 [Chitinophagaceae bacterium]|nr:hypothetical protein [Chitinophagaceae bacterium]
MPLAILYLGYLQRFETLKYLLAKMQISKQKYYYWKNKVTCKKSSTGSCIKHHPNQLTEKEVEHITEYLHKPDYEYWSLSSIFYQLLRDNKLFCGLTTFYKYVSHEIIEARRKKKPPKLYSRITSNHVFEKLHLDTTLLRLKNFTRVYITRKFLKNITLPILQDK